MQTLGFVEAFAKFGAKLENPMWAVSSIADDGSFVMSCWSHYFKSGEEGILLYVDSLSRWKGNALGNRLLSAHLKKATTEGLLVRLVVATAVDTKAVDSGQDGSKIKKTFHVRQDVVGKIRDFDGDAYAIEFKRL